MVQFFKGFVLLLALLCSTLLYPTLLFGKGTSIQYTATYFRTFSYFLPLFLIPPPTNGPPFLACSAIFFLAWASAFCFSLKAISSSVRSLCCFLADFNGLALPP